MEDGGKNNNTVLQNNIGLKPTGFSHSFLLETHSIFFKKWKLLGTKKPDANKDAIYSQTVNKSVALILLIKLFHECVIAQFEYM